LRVSRSEDGLAQTKYLRSSVLGGAVAAEVIWTGAIWQWSRGYVYAGSSLLAEQHNGVYFVHEDPITKSKRVTSTSGAIQSTVELDPYGAEVTNFSSNTAFQPRKFTSYERDGNGTDEAMMRRYNRWHSRFDQPDPYDGSYDLTDPQTFNRYSYTQGDPANLVDPSGLDEEVGPGDVVSIYQNIPPWFWPGGGSGGFFEFGAPGPVDTLGPVQKGPQNPTVVPPSKPIPNLIRDLLKEGDCADYVQKLLNKAIELFAGKYPHANTISDAIDMISKAGGYQLDGKDYHTVSGDLFYKGGGAQPGTVHLIPFRTFGTPSAANVAYAQGYYAYGGLHETFHLARQGGYDDELMATAAFSLAGKKLPTPPANLDGYGRAAFFSALFDDELLKHCPK
jgi:RHS repeat-associated protein